MNIEFNFLMNFELIVIAFIFSFSKMIAATKLLGQIRERDIENSCHTKRR